MNSNSRDSSAIFISFICTRCSNRVTFICNSCMKGILLVIHLYELYEGNAVTTGSIYIIYLYYEGNTVTTSSIYICIMKAMDIVIARTNITLVTNTL